MFEKEDKQLVSSEKPTDLVPEKTAELSENKTIVADLNEASVNNIPLITEERNLDATLPEKSSNLTNNVAIEPISNDNIPNSLVTAEKS